MRARKAVTITVILAAAAAASWFGWTWHRVPAVELTRPARGPAVQAVYATGIVEPVFWAKVTPLVRGRIATLCSCEGQEVQSGAELARLDEREAKAEIAELAAREKFLSSEVERYRRLLERRVVSPQAYERATSDYAQVRAAIAAARQRLDHLTLRSPMDGVVLRSDGEVGEVAEPGQVLFWVGKPKPLWVVGEVDEEDIPVVREGQGVLIKADAFPGRALSGTVDRITPKGDPVTKNYRVRIGLPADSPLMIGMTTELNIVVRRVADALLIPAGALSGDSVWTVKGGRATPRAVTVGIRGTERVEITAGLGADEEIVLAPPAGLAEGQRVRARRPRGAPP